MKPASILITDDERNIRMLLRTALEADGYVIAEAANGQEALDAIRRDAPDVVILDLNMPVLDGMAVLEQLKSADMNKKTRVVVLTAHGSIPVAVKATRLGAVDFLEKPVTPDDLRETVRSVLDEPELDSPSGVPRAVGGYDDAIHRVRRALRVADFTNAEALLTKIVDGPAKRTAEYFNLLGILYEAQAKWRLARKCYGKAIKADKTYEPAQANMRRFYELHTFGHSKQPVVLGDEKYDTLLT
jgi:DNA-binding response OmpR family regulator